MTKLHEKINKLTEEGFEVQHEGYWYYNEKSYHIIRLLGSSSSRFLDTFLLWDTYTLKNFDLTDIKSSWNLNYDGCPLYDFITELKLKYNDKN